MTVDEFFAEAKRLGLRMIPDDPAMIREMLDRKDAEIAAWRERFPQYAYRPQDGCVALRKE